MAIWKTQFDDDDHRLPLPASEIIVLAAAELLGETRPTDTDALKLSDIAPEDRAEAQRIAKQLIEVITQSKRGWARADRDRGLAFLVDGILGGNVFQIFNAAKATASTSDSLSAAATVEEVQALILDIAAGRPPSLYGRPL